ncbi:TPA: DUF3944 domain-containing protein [Vibrio vulnificus]|nr:DUF3944 domain-containing protein [Vibrio vulnificus]
MSNTYKQDKDLELLRYADNDMLGVLVNYLTTDKDGKTRYTETLTEDKQFQAAKGDYQQVWQQIAVNYSILAVIRWLIYSDAQGLNIRKFLLMFARNLASKQTTKLRPLILSRLF